MKFGRCRERRSKSPTPRKGHRSAKSPSQEPLQTSALRSTSSTPGETPADFHRLPPRPTPSHRGQSHPAGALGATHAPSAVSQQGLPETGWDGRCLAETSEQGPDITSTTSSPAGTLAGTGSRHAADRVAKGCPALLPPLLKDFTCEWAKLPQSLPMEEAGNKERNGAELVAGRRHLEPACWDPSIAFRLFHVLPGLSKAFLHSVKTISPVKRKTWERPDCFLFIMESLALQDFTEAKGSQHCRRLGKDAARAVGARVQ